MRLQEIEGEEKASQPGLKNSLKGVRELKLEFQRWIGWFMTGQSFIS